MVLWLPDGLKYHGPGEVKPPNIRGSDRICAGMATLRTAEPSYLREEKCWRSRWNEFRSVSNRTLTTADYKRYFDLIKARGEDPVLSTSFYVGIRQRNYDYIFAYSLCFVFHLFEPLSGTAIKFGWVDQPDDGVLTLHDTRMRRGIFGASLSVKKRSIALHPPCASGQKEIVGTYIDRPLCWFSVGVYDDLYGVNARSDVVQHLVLCIWGIESTISSMTGVCRSYLRCPYILWSWIQMH